eukprot:CAMPEP_0171517092 /NCGR_PEP_ID=MMETSP0959-20130129/4446_1 /TAXON_ID=87120 /ORGANISM="Aurantiochytrium limacinum, Strain ATCCMYA-1381" /LENGTH=40 /DNA_ID= /DNA_START= /DNA_END= /DNA_ORIENTATION=
MIDEKSRAFMSFSSDVILTVRQRQCKYIFKLRAFGILGPR